MEQTKLTNLIVKLEEYSSKNPKPYRLRVALLAALGYAYLGAVVVALLATIYITLVHVRITAVTLKLVWIPLVLVGLILRSLWITIPEPDGYPLEESDAGPLFAMIRELEKHLDGPRVHTVLLSDEFNAGIVQIPRFGMFGWLKNYLVVGLPLLTVLHPDELRAVLAHEFGHLSGQHGRFSGWIYRLRESWIQVLTAVQTERSYASFLFAPFLNWYAPFFQAYSFVLARLQEYEADALAGKIAGKSTAARALVRIALTQRSIGEEFWPAFYRGVRNQSQPPKDPFAQFVKQVGQKNTQSKTEKWFYQELSVRTGYDDTHPALADRLKAIGFDGESLDGPPTIQVLLGSVPDAGTAANHFLTNVPEEFVSRSNRLWREQLLSSWQERYRQVQEAGKRLAELDKKAETETLTSDEQWERIGHLGDLEGDEATMSPLRNLLTSLPTHARANFALGAMLLQRQDSEGIRHLELAMQHDYSLTGYVYSLFSDFYHGRGEKKIANEYRDRAEHFYEAVQKANEEAMTISVSDRFAPHDLNDAAVNKLRDQLSRIRGLARAYLVRKLVKPPQEFIFVMGVIADYTWQHGQNEKHIDELMGGLIENIQLDGRVVFVSLDAETHLLPFIDRVPGSTVYARDGVLEAEVRLMH